MLLCLDIGNTSIVVCEYDNSIINSFRIDTSNNIKKEDFLTNLKSSIVDDIIISSVVPSINELISNILYSIYNKKPIFVSVEMNTNINILIDNPKELGSDLLIAGVAASKRKGNYLIIDMGTATKFLVVKGNDFLGGAIAPGLMTSFEVLFKEAELLEKIELVTPKKIVGTSTVECIQSGYIVGFVSMIEKMVEKIQKEVGDLNVILTGGNAIFVKESLSYEYCPYLLIDGLVEVYNLNK